MSDTISISSNHSGDISSPGGVVIEEVGHLTFPEFSPKKIALLNYTLAALSEDGRLLLGELRTRGGDDWTLAGRSVTNLNSNESKRYLDLSLLANAKHGQGACSLIFLVEKKNKERYMTAHNIKHGKILILDEEFTSYDKVNVLGKGVTHIAPDLGASEPTIYSASNLLRKLRLEDAGTNLKPTTARAQIPSEVQDGTIAMAVQNIRNSPSLVIMSFKTKSASRNKFMIEWFQARKDELTCLKIPVKLPEQLEPTCLLIDPKDCKNAYVLCVNRLSRSTSMFKISKGRKHEEAIATFNFEIEMAVIGMNADQNVTMVVYNSQKEVAKIFTLQKTEGFRGKHPICANCPSLELLNSPSHVVSCANSKWQLSVAQADIVFNPKHNIQMSLVTLLDSSGGGGGKHVLEPETNLPYRLRILSCETQGFGVIPILLEDLDRVFENADDKLQPCVLKICMNQVPCKDSLSQLSALLMSGRIGLVEVHYVNMNNSGKLEIGSDRLQTKPISIERFRGYVTDMDWTQVNQRQGTFTLEDNAKGNNSSSRIPRSSMSSSNNSSFQQQNGIAQQPQTRVSSAFATTPKENNQNLKTLSSQLSECLIKMKRDEDVLQKNLMMMQKNMEMLNNVLIEEQQVEEEEDRMEEEQGGEEEEETLEGEIIVA